MNDFLHETRLLDYSHQSITELFGAQGWLEQSDENRIKSVYDFVRDKIPFGYNRKEIIPASQVLHEHLGQCNTKGILLMALLRRAGFPCRLHAFSIAKKVQAGVVPPSLHKRLPNEIQHSWVDVLHRGEWLNIEGFIIDTPFLRQIQTRFSQHVGGFCGYAIAVDDLRNPPNEWTGRDTYIQKTAIVGDLGVFDSPDAFYSGHPSNVTGIKGILWQTFYCRLTNDKLTRIRSGEFPANAEQFVADLSESPRRVVSVGDV